MITSAQNPKIKWVRQLQNQGRVRREEQIFIVEGVRLAEEALKAGWKARLVLCTEDLNERGRSVAEGFAAQGAQLEVVPEPVMQAASDTQTPQGLLAALEWQALEIPPAVDFIFIPDRVRDPGNLGTMLRSAAAAGVQAVLLPPETADAFAPKTIRAGMGAHFRLPIRAMGWEEIGSQISKMKVFVAAAGEGVSYIEAKFRNPLALIIGGEAEGASEHALRLRTEIVHIPMPGGSESLNAAVAAGILMFEVVRQRQASKENK
jgi:RNA methyltransferase, TrmH family